MACFLGILTLGNTCSEERAPSPPRPVCLEDGQCADDDPCTFDHCGNQGLCVNELDEELSDPSCFGDGGHGGQGTQNDCQGLLGPDACSSCIEAKCCPELSDCMADADCADCLTNANADPNVCSASAQAEAIVDCIESKCSADCQSTPASCDVSAPACDESLADECRCYGCDPDGCNDAEGSPLSDCVCSVCMADAYCADAKNCNGDGVCEPHNEGCMCADCADHPECN